MVSNPTHRSNSKFKYCRIKKMDIAEFALFAIGYVNWLTSQVCFTCVLQWIPCAISIAAILLLFNSIIIIIIKCIQLR